MSTAPGAKLVPPLTAEDARAVAAFVDRLRQELRDNVVDIRLFGSKARGDAIADSDIDVLVIVQPEADRIRLETAVSDIAFDVSLDYAVHISPCVLTTRAMNDPVWRETQFLRTIEREGLPV
ncbi:MAG: nucleotidyltransferase domain-containing protein [Acidobacteria bacterium]|nr:nucleotidyltransferase domain-containing protein [Acidobacteriota bacterium]